MTLGGLILTSHQSKHDGEGNIKNIHIGLVVDVNGD
jgi:hypothetical protein